MDRDFIRNISTRGAGVHMQTVKQKAVLIARGRLSYWAEFSTKKVTAIVIQDKKGHPIWRFTRAGKTWMRKIRNARGKTVNLYMEIIP